MQVAVIIRLKCFPPYITYANQRYYNGVIFLKGLLLDISIPSSYVFHTVWSCPEECEGNEVILHFIPKAPPKCYVCRSILFENSGLRRCGEQVKATFLSEFELMPKSYLVADDLIPKLKTGRMYNIHVIVLKKIKAVWSVEETAYLPAPLTYPIPDDIKELFEVCDGVPWKFIYCLASSIGARVCPLHCFMHVKISLLLSLVSVKANSVLGSPIINVLISGYETKYVGDLMKEAVKLADRSVFLGNSHSSVKTSFIASSGGVCVLPLPLYLYNQKQISFILKSLESGEITTENSEMKMQCAVWAHTNYSKKITMNNLSSIFGTVCRGDYGEYSEDISECLLQGSMEETKISRDEVRAIETIMSYINLTAGVNVTLDRTAENLLKNYFLAARKERPQVATIGSIGALIAVSMTSARLCHRSLANIDDALLAIWLHVCGSPEPRFAPEEYLQTPASIQKLQKNMTHFKDWLEQFTGSCIF
ncbi:unnamed protein product [Parnassius apollo]|uniref:(apollo) hypothetical protein n=1 Tax=Parnassius apollo TaxID=110799 RepID=A0A8S3XW78_PARAO|nr:unnamed protein product [Parnassius apollo]